MVEVRARGTSIRVSLFARPDLEANSFRADQHQLGDEAQPVLPVDRLHVEGSEHRQNEHLDDYRGELPADAVARARAERDEGVIGKSRFARQESLRTIGVRLREVAGVAMQLAGVDENGRARRDLVAHWKRKNEAYKFHACF